MKRSKLVSTLMLLTVLLMALPLSSTAQEQGDVEQTRAPQPEWGGAWQNGPVTPWTWSRFDGEYYSNTGLVYFMGGRLPSGASPDTDGSVWSFDPDTGIYADLGVDIPSPVSNYQINLLQDATGWGLYTLCGRPTGGGVVNVVQVYYPDTNTVVQLPDADNYPGEGTCTSGVNIVHDNKVYVAGGFDSTNTFDDTWVFDPMAASGSRWTQIPSATLTTARAYIMGVAVDDLLYAIGGAWFDGTNLINVDTVEVLDPNAASPTWDDAAAADMPEICSSSRAWGFDSDVDYLDPDGTPFAGKIVSGCGFWADENNHVYAYDTTTDTWEDFPWLITDRRDVAGAFVPSESNNGGGVPGLWLFGGRKDADSSYLNSTEFYDVQTVAPIYLLPTSQQQIAQPGDIVIYNLEVVNNTDASLVLNISHGDNVWPATMPATVGPVDAGASAPFEVEVALPEDALVPFVDLLVVTATVQSDPAVFAKANIRTQTIPVVDGHIYDANTGLPVAGYVVIYDNDDPEIGWETWTGPDGYYLFQEPEFELRSYDIYAVKIGYDRVETTLTLTGMQTTTVEFYLPASILTVDPPAIDVEVYEPMSTTVQLNLINEGTADLLFRIDEVAPESGLWPTGVSPVKPLGVNQRVYDELDASPDGTAEVLVVMAEQADLSAAYNIADWAARGQYVYDTLKATADSTQAVVRKALDEAGVKYQTFLSVNALGLTASKATIDRLAAMPGVQAVEPAATFAIPEPIIEAETDAPEAIPWNLANIGADQVWTDYGVTGEGIVVANIDTGVEFTHPALVAQYRGNLGGGTFDHAYNWWDPRGACEIAGYTAGEPCDNNGHGTHTMGSMVGSDNPADPLAASNAIGVAPGAKWIACKGCEDVEGWPCSSFALLQCADFILAPWDSDMDNADATMRPHVVNNSWGGSPDDGWYFNDALSAWRASGIFPAFSGGNDGPECSTSHSPGDYYNSFATGAVSSSDVIAGFSSRGPSAIGVQKPQVAAPGSSVRSSVPGNAYALYSGTSMASPHTAGQIALIWSAQPELVGQVWATERLVEQTAMEIQDDQCNPGAGERPNYVYGWGRIEVAESVSVALSIDWDIPWLTVEPDMGTVPAGGELAVDVTLDATALTLGECYTATLSIETNDPEQGLVALVPVEVCMVEQPNFYFYLPIIVRGSGG